MKEQIAILQDLVNDYNEGKVSALVGAGFSKNVSQEYPNWAQLLEDMYKDVYSEEIETYYQNYLHCNPDVLQPDQSENNTNKEKIKKKYIEKRLKTEDLLALVSKYMKRKGYREAVDIYIEEHTPHACKKGDKLLLTINNKTTELPISNLSAQLELVKCAKFLNIYTTNYDNLIEIANNEYGNKNFDEKVIVTSERLSNSVSKKNIIKIHGSLRDNDDAPFGFDGDNNLCYIIAREDYDSYFSKHEAFSYMMRIAMLSGKFCLLGFSGTDANYLAWLNWMRDVIMKGDGKKIYLVSVDKSLPSKELKLFNKNHFVEIIYLWDNTILKEIGVSDSDLGKEEDNRTVVTAFLKHLNESSRRGSESITTSEKVNEDENTDKMYGASNASYKTLWLEVSDKIQNNEIFTETLTTIIDAESENRINKIVYPMERVVSFFERHDNFTEDEASLFSLAVKKTGKLPFMFDDKIVTNNILQHETIWQELINRSDTLQGIRLQLEGKTNVIKYENILRSMFSFDFSKAKKLLKEWNPLDCYIQHHSMLSALYKESILSAREDLYTYIINTTTPKTEKLFASNIGNYISGEWFKRPYDCTVYYEIGLDGLGDIQASILHEIGPKREKPNTLDWIGTTFRMGYSNAQARKCLKYILFLIESGILPNYYGTYFLAIEDWYFIAHNLMHFFPYPCYFYSCMYNDKNVLRRIGQEFAYNKDLQETNKILLLKSLDALTNRDTPSLFITGLYLLSGRIYRSVEEDVWFNSFKANIMDVYLNDMAKLTSNECLLENFRMGVGALKDKSHIEYVFINTLKHFNEAPETVCSIFEDNLSLRCLGGKLNDEAEKLLMHIILKSDSENVYELVYLINSGVGLTATLKEAIRNRIDKIPEGKMPENPNNLVCMILLLPANDTLRNNIKSQFLQTDMWYCGLKNEGKWTTDPRYIRLNLLQDDIIWSDAEFKCIKENLEANISLFKQNWVSIHSDPFVRTQRIQYFSDVKLYIEKLSDSRKQSLSDVYSIATKFFNEINNGYSFENELLSTQPAEVSAAIKQLEMEIDSFGLDKRIDDFHLILDRALLMQASAVKTTLGTIRHILCKQQNFYLIKEQKLIDKILRILKLYQRKTDDLLEMDIDIYWAFNSLYGISKYLKENGVNDETITFWLTDEWVLKFISPEVL